MFGAIRQQSIVTRCGETLRAKNALGLHEQLHFLAATVPVEGEGQVDMNEAIKRRSSVTESQPESGIRQKPAADIETLKRPFARGSTSSGTNGAGLGLAIVETHRTCARCTI